MSASPPSCREYHTPPNRRFRSPGGGIVKVVSSRRPLARPTAAIAYAGLALACTLAALSYPNPAAAVSRPTGRSLSTSHSLFQSRELWATIDVCNPSDQPNTVGIRGSMPGDGVARDAMYMRFRLQYQDATSKLWIDLAHGADSGFVAVGAAKAARQGGRSFQLVPVAGRPASTLRGVVSFQWRRGAHVVHAVSRATTAGHQSLAGADPASFSTATCVIG